MKQTDMLSKGSEEALPVLPNMERLEEILRSAADFEPETEASYNFAAAAMARRRFRSRSTVLTFAGCACTAMLVWWGLPRIVSNPIFIHPPEVQDGGTQVAVDDSSSGDTGTSSQLHLRVPGLRPMQSPLRPDRTAADESANSEAALPATWETETVDRYASGLIKPTYVEQKAADGTLVRKPAVEVIPLDSGERPSSGDSGGMGVVSLASYGSAQEEATK